MSRSLTRAVHLWPPPGHARHGTGSSCTLGGRLAGHALGRCARLTQVQPERGGSRVLARTGPGGTS
jgi:hypothetical protein